MIVVLNAGSSSIKFSVFAVDGDNLTLRCRGQIESLQNAPHFIATGAEGAVLSERRWDDPLRHDDALDHLFGFLRSGVAGGQVLGIGHRVVHGGMRFTQPVLVDGQIIRALETLIPLAPLHQPHNLAPMHRLRERAPDVPQVACFDTAFHDTNPEIARRFALPERFHAAGVRRYGFHGLSYEYIASVLPQFDETAARGRTIVAHLGNGASMCAMVGGRSIASTMGFTALDGLPMGTRSGAIDPGVVLYLLDELGMDARAIEHLLYNESGLLGVSGLSSDMRTLRASDDPRARLAIDLYVYRIRRELGSLAAALGGLDALVFTAGIGEHAAPIRARVCADAAWLGVELDAAANENGGPRISTPTAQVAAWVIPTDEERMIAQHTLTLIRGTR
ncbi:MAG: acetate/propionate family kinase [Burkholderiales bacterium]|nr:acetate/propionate family kinase [Burkholderiales bacterium]